MFIHTATIVRPTHTITAGKKVTGEETIATGVMCWIAPAGDAESASVLGMSATEAYVGVFPAGTDVELRDEITWQDPAVPVVMTVVGDQAFYTPRDSTRAHHVKVALQRKKVG